MPECRRLGATNEELGELFGVAPRTVDNWIACHPEFAKAVESGRLIADSRIADGLYTRAIGFERKVKRTALYRGEPKDYETNVYFPPDTQACIFWLRNRRRQSWRDGPNAAAPDDDIDDIARLEAASERARHQDNDPPDGGSAEGGSHDGY